LQTALNEIIEITEGTTKILVPSGSVNEKIPPREPAFFNPRAKLNRDFSVIAYSAFWKNFDGPKKFLDGLSGLGARGLRVANEIKVAETVICNDANPNAVNLCAKSADINKLQNLQTSQNEVCKFFNEYSTKGQRGSIVDLDPFGSPTKYLDCAIRATMHGGMLSTTATDLQVLHGLFKFACKRRYYGVPIKTEYSNEIAIRLVLGCICLVAYRMDIQISPLFVDNSQHYYRTYVKILNRPAQKDSLGYILHCKSCGHRIISETSGAFCELCNSKLEVAGPLWIGRLFDKEFVKTMQEEIPNFTVDKRCEKTLQKCFAESDLPATYFTLDEIAAKMKRAPIALEKMLENLEKNGFTSSPTSLNPTGFRTNCNMNQICKIFTN
jgi:tRNA (guanine26-N2/guanine27-N2)-dimethyltransferase